MKKIVFNKERLGFSQMVSNLLLPDLFLENGTLDDDFIKDIFTVQLEAFILSHTAQKIPIQYWCKKPTFFDWLFGREKMVTFELEVKDVLIDPPVLPKKTCRLYFTKELD